MAFRSFLLLAALLAGPALAQHAPDGCVTVSDSNLPDGFAAWAKPAEPVRAAAAAGAARPELVPDHPLAVALRPAAEVTLPTSPARARSPDNAHAGLLSLRIPADGVWRISASAPVWIDVIGPAGAVSSVGHGRMAPCTSLRKTVAFNLPAGIWLVQLSGNPGPEVKLMLSRAP